MSDRISRPSALLALLLIAPAPSIGAWMMFWSHRGEAIGSVAYALGKVWLYGLPVVWLLLVDRQRFSLSKPSRGGFGAGAILGLIIAGVILAVYYAFAKARIDPAIVQQVVAENGLHVPWKYVAACLWLATGNALLEEYAFRWFMYTRCEALVSEPSPRGRGQGEGASDGSPRSVRALTPNPSPRGRGAWSGPLAITLAGILFTAHHVIVLKAYFGWDITILASAGIFIGGCAWSALYLRYRSIWPGYLSHVIVDLAIFAIGWELIFGW